LDRLGRFGAEVRAAVAASLAAFFRSHGPTRAAALAFYALLSCIPLFFVMLAGYGLVVGDTWTAQLLLRRQMAIVAPFMDAGLVERARRLLWASPHLTWQSLAFIVWSSWLFVGALRRALALPWRAAGPAPRTWRMWPATLAGVVRGPLVGLLFVAALTLALSFAALPRLEPAGSLARALSPVWGVACLTGLFAAIYLLFLPRRRPLRAVGGLSAGLAGAVFTGSAFFTDVLVDPSRYHLVYGSLSGAVLFLLWLDYIACLLLWGAWFLRCWQLDHPRPPGSRRLFPAAWPARPRRRPANVRLPARAADGEGGGPGD
jgi:membrane protein